MYEIRCVIYFQGTKIQASGEKTFVAHREYRGRLKSRTKTHDGIVFLQQDSEIAIMVLKYCTLYI